MGAVPVLQRLRCALDEAMVGQEDAKRGLLLALLAREHAYLEGPPGCGKSALAEAALDTWGAPSARLTIHRDLRDSDLLGDPVLRRSPHGAGERIARSIHPGPLLRAETAIFDDLSRAPGEALAPLLRMLSERVALGRALPLQTAVATAPPATAADAYADPLEPTQLDRFAIQIEMRGLLQGRDGPRSRALLDRTASALGPLNDLSPVTAADRYSLHREVAALPIFETTRRAWLLLIERLREVCNAEGGALLSDRSFGPAGLRVLRAHARLRGVTSVEPDDLHALRYMAARRLPERVRELLDDLIAAAIDESRRDASQQAAVRRGQSAGGVPADAEGSAQQNPAGEIGEAAPAGEGGLDAAEVASLLRALRGRLDRGRAERDEHPGGAPRRLQALRRFDELLDADPVELVLLAEATPLGALRALRREKAVRGGALVLVRDVSASMEGPWTRWAGAVVTGLVRAAARRRMRVGYIEFNHRAHPLGDGFHLLQRRYREILRRAAAAPSGGRTNYEAPLAHALEALGNFRGGNRHLVMLTDGVPVLGDPHVSHARQQARHLGVRIHTVFLGRGNCPGVLDSVSLETGGARFSARPDAGGRIRVGERSAAAA